MLESKNAQAVMRAGRLLLERKELHPVLFFCRRKVGVFLEAILLIIYFKKSNHKFVFC